MDQLAARSVAADTNQGHGGDARTSIDGDSHAAGRGLGSAPAGAGEDVSVIYSTSVPDRAITDNHCQSDLGGIFEKF